MTGPRPSVWGLVGPSDASIRASFVPPVVAGLVTFALAWRTLLPGVGFWDTAEFQAVGPLLGTAHPPGYPSYVILGWVASVILQPFGEPAFRMNLLAAILGALTAGLCAVLVLQLTRRSLLAGAAGVVFGALPVTWRVATHADPHGLHGALVALLLVLLLGWGERRRAELDWRPASLAGRRADRSRGDERHGDRWLLAASVIFGLALGNHSLTVLLAPGIAFYILAVEPAIVRRPRLVVGCALAVAVTVGLVYLELPLRAGPFRAPLVYGHPETPVGFLYIVLGVQFLGALDPFGTLGAKLADLARISLEQLGPIAPLVPFGIVATALRRPRYALLTIPPLLLTCWFAASYENAEIERYYLVPALLAVTWVAVLVDGLVSRLVRVVPAVARLAPGVDPGLGLLAAALVLAPTLAALPTRAAAVDRSADRRAADWLDFTLGRLEPNAVVVSWWDFSTPLWYAQLLQGRRLDVQVVDDRTILDQQLGGVTDVIDANLGRRPVYLIRLPADLEPLAARYRLEYLAAPADQPLVRVLGPIEAGS